ncbi:hypothetical protein GA0115246_100708, partial [Streptomyces sp. SolWspMP-sol7th]
MSENTTTETAAGPARRPGAPAPARSRRCPVPDLSLVVLI